MSSSSVSSSPPRSGRRCHRRHRVAPLYGQVVVGPPGSGKTTFCDGMQQYCKLLGRNAVVINLDPANEGTIRSKKTNNPNVTPPPATRTEQTTTSPSSIADSHLPYDPIFDICQEVIDLSSVMEQLNLGPNGGLMYCMEYLETHADEIIDKVIERLFGPSERDDNSRHDHQEPDYYLLLDLPGQVELYTHSTCVQDLLRHFAVALDIRWTAVQLVDALYCTEATKFLSATILGTSTMLRLELPTVNVLSKVDLLASDTAILSGGVGGGGGLPMDLEFFTECHDLHRLVPFLDTHVVSMHTGNREQDVFRDDDLYDYVENADYQAARRKRAQSKLAQKHGKLLTAIAEVVEDFGLLSFIPLDITNAESVGRVLARIDKANGYVFKQQGSNSTSANAVPQDMFQCAIQADLSSYDSTADIREHVASHERIRELQR